MSERYSIGPSADGGWDLVEYDKHFLSKKDAIREKIKLMHPEWKFYILVQMVVYRKTQLGLPIPDNPTFEEEQARLWQTSGLHFYRKELREKIYKTKEAALDAAKKFSVAIQKAARFEPKDSHKYRRFFDVFVKGENGMLETIHKYDPARKKWNVEQWDHSFGTYIYHIIEETDKIVAF